MSDDNDQGGTSQEGEGTTDGSSQSQNGTGQPDELSLARKRQAGAEAARQVAEAKAKEYEAELAKYRAAAQTDAEKELSELARQTARAEAAEKRAQDAETAAQAKVLDKLYPEARAKFPEIADEARLAELQAFYAEGTEQELPTPMRHNEKSGSQGGAGGEKKPESAADVKARLLASPMPAGWGS